MQTNGSTPLSSVLAGTPSRRETHKARTRQALREAALQLFASQGYETTTTEEIAENAGVSARTFFRYFPTKETVLFLGRRRWMQSFASAFTGQPRSMSDLTAMKTAFERAGSGLSQLRDMIMLYQRAVGSSPTLRGREFDHKRDDLVVVAEAIAQRHGLLDPDERCNLLAEVGMLARGRALDRWLAGPTTLDLGVIINEEFTRLAALLSQA